MQRVISRGSTEEVAPSSLPIPGSTSERHRSVPTHFKTWKLDVFLLKTEIPTGLHAARQGVSLPSSLARPDVLYKSGKGLIEAEIIPALGLEASRSSRGKECGCPGLVPAVGDAVSQE